MTVHLSTAQVVAIHDRESRQPLRDPGALESAVEAVRATWGGHPLRAELMDQAAALLSGVCQAQAFVDGNKRTAWIATDVFLRLNGTSIGDATPDEVIDLIEGISDRRHDEEAITEWLRRHSSIHS